MAIMNKNARKRKRNTLKYRLGKIWAIINRSDKNEFASREEFELWAKGSGYKPWKVLYLIDESRGYNKDNCLWGFDKRSRGEIVDILENDSEANVCKIIKRIAYDLEELKSRLMTASYLASDLTNSKQISNRRKVKDLSKDLEMALKYVTISTNEVDEIEMNV